MEGSLGFASPLVLKSLTGFSHPNTQRKLLFEKPTSSTKSMTMVSETRTRSAVQTSEQTSESFNKRSAAARKLWQDPVFRAKMSAARSAGAARRRAQQKSALTTTPPPIRLASRARFSDQTHVDATRKDQTGCEELINIGGGHGLMLRDDTVSDSALKALEVDAYRSMPQSEKLKLFHSDKHKWMDMRLREGEALRSQMNCAEVKRQRQLERKAKARERHERIRARKAMEEAKESRVLG